MTKLWQASASATLVGSMPHQDRTKVVDMIFNEMSHIPAWPQLPFFEPEQMMVQYLEGLPGVERENGRLLVRTDTQEFESDLYGFYEEYLEVESQARDVNDSRFGFGPETGRTFALFLERLDRISNPLQALKGQIVGPFTLLAGLKDQHDRALLYDDRMQDVVVKHLAMKAQWQIQQLKAFGSPVIIFLDEPALAGFGSSAFISVSRELIQQLLQEIIDTIHRAGGMAGVHVCANTDWLLAFDSGVDIINFDAYNYLDKFLLYREPLLHHLQEGRYVAWGIVPTLDPLVIEQETPESLAERLIGSIEETLAPDWPLPRILKQSLFTPSCGCGSLPEPVAERVVHLTRSLGELMKSKL